MITRTAVGLLALASILLAQAQPKTVAASKGTLRVAIDVKGRFRPADPAKLKLDCEKYGGPFKIEMITPSGSWVNAGDIVARLDRKAYAEALVEQTAAMERAEMDMKHYLAKLGMEKERRAEGLARSVRDHKRAAKKLKGYREFEKEFSEESERLTAQSREHGMERSKDELTQLEKMYSEDELVDATEEIVLKRQRRGYARSLASYDLWKRRTAYNKEWYFAWREQDFVSSAESKATALRQAKANAEMAEARSAADLKKRERDMDKKREAFQKFQADGEKLTLRASVAGLFLHGESGVTVKYEKDGQLRNKTVVGRIMKAGALEVVGEIREADILRVGAGIACEVKPAAAADQTLTGTLKVGYLPQKSGGYEAIVTMGELPTGIRPGMTGAVSVVLKEVRDAVLVPKSAVHKADGQTFVNVWADTTTRRDVVTGEDDGKQIVIREGLEEGESVVVPAPAK